MMCVPKSVLNLHGYFRLSSKDTHLKKSVCQTLKSYKISLKILTTKQFKCWCKYESYDRHIFGGDQICGLSEMLIYINFFLQQEIFFWCWRAGPSHTIFYFNILVIYANIESWSLNFNWTKPCYYRWVPESKVNHLKTFKEPKTS